MHKQLLNTFFVTLVVTSFMLVSCTKMDNNTNAQEQQDSDKQEEGVPYLPDLPDSVPEKTDKKPKRAKLPPVKDSTPKSRADHKASMGALPNFSSIDNSTERKREFISFMAPLIKQENDSLRSLRMKIKQLYVSYQLGHNIPSNKIEWLANLAKEYRVKETNFPSEESFRALLLHVDIIPVELALAQAANESAWGTSFFARKGNNIFGKWCFSKGCGIVPRSRAEGSHHEVKAYSSVSASVEDYLHHLNSHPAYKQLRVLRYEQRKQGQQPEGYHIALGLQKYSAIGMKYVNILRSIMNKNQELMDV